jgi:hypothetical protein
LSDEKWAQYFSKGNYADSHLELLRLAQFGFAIPGRSGKAKTDFSLISSSMGKIDEAVC